MAGFLARSMCNPVKEKQQDEFLNVKRIFIFIFLDNYSAKSVIWMWFQQLQHLVFWEYLNLSRRHTYTHAHKIESHMHINT